MRAPAVSFVCKIVAAVAVGLLVCGLALPYAPAFAEGEGAPGALLASSLMDGSASVVREDVALAASEDDAAPEPVIGSFTVDGLTFAVTEGTNVQLVGVATVEADASTLLLPESVTYGDVEYAVSSIGAYAFYLSGVTSVELPVRIVDVDDRAFRSSDVASVEVAEDNPNYSSFDGALYDADTLSLLLIPEGKQGTVLLPKTAESASPSVFSHCPLVTQIAVEEGSAAFASENGLLYTSDLTTLLRVPAGATNITIREGCTTIVAGAMEACAQLTTINAPATVISISSYLFEQQPETVMAPVAVAAVEDDAEADSSDEGESAEAAPQLSAMVALSSADDGLPAVGASAINLVLPVEASMKPWQASGFVAEGNGDEEMASETAEAPSAIIAQDVSLAEVDAPVASLQEVTAYADLVAFVNANGGVFNTTLQNLIGYEQINHNTTINYWDFRGETVYLRNRETDAIVDTITLQPRDWCILVGWTTGGFYPARTPVLQTTGAGLDGTGWYANWSVFNTWNPNGGYWGDDPTKTNTESGWAWNNSRISSFDDPESSPSNSYRGPTSVKREGHSFYGWSTSQTATVGSETVLVGNSPTVYYATWKANQYTVSFDPNGGSGGQSIDVRATYDSDMPSISTIKPERKGYTFMGWYDDPDYTKAQSTQYYTAAGISSHKWDKAGDAKLFAGWKKNPVYTITLKKNIGNDITSEYGKVYLWYDKGWYATANPEDDTTPLSRLDISLSWAGRTCKGFSKDKNAGTAAYWTDLSTLPSVRAFSSSQSLYAVWETNPVYKVTISSEHGTGGTSEIYLWYGKGWYSESNPTDSSTAISSITFPSYPGYSPTGCWDSLTSSNKIQCIDADGNITAGVEAVTQDTNWYVEWLRGSYVITFDGQGGTVSRFNMPDKDTVRALAETGISITTTGSYYRTHTHNGYVFAPKKDAATYSSEDWYGATRQGYVFKGWFLDKEGGTQLSGPEGTTGVHEITEPVTIYAQWEPVITFDGQGGTITRHRLSDSGWEAAETGTSITTQGSYYRTHGVNTNIFAPTKEATGYGPDDFYSASRQGYVFKGWFLDKEGGTQLSGPEGTTGVHEITEPVTIYAQWEPAISVDVPIEVTAQVDLLGIEDQVPASGYIESRCGAPLAVDEVSFTALPGAADLFGEANTARVSLQALALEGSASWDASAPTFSFALDANATESDASRLAALRMEAYEDHIPIAYRFAIPEDVLASIDPARFEQATTPVCSVVYKIALASA